jgi:hypothetical protein
VCCVLCAVCCVLCAVCCVLCAVCCVLCAVCCVMCAVCVCATCLCACVFLSVGWFRLVCQAEACVSVAVVRDWEKDAEGCVYVH